jgi:type I restriction enzyme S subunit
MSELIESLKKSLLADLLTGENISYKDLQSLTTEISSGSTPSRQNPDFWNGDIPWVKSGELHRPSISTTEECVTQLALSKSSIKLIPEGAVLLAMYGATAGAVSQLAIPATTNQAICSLIPNEDLDAGYLKAVLKSKLSELLGLRSGGAQQNLSLTTIKSFKIPVPEKPIQIVFASKVHTLEKISEKADLLQQRFLDLSKSLMAKAFETKSDE